MSRVHDVFRGAQIAIAVALALVLAACAQNRDEELDAGAVAAAPGSGPGSVQEFMVTVGDRVFFETDSTDLSAVARQTLDRQAEWLLLYRQFTILVEGHADERGTREYNIALGARRAEAVQSYLASRGVPLTRMSTISFGKERPVAVCNDISCWSQNRRAVTVVNNIGV